MAYFDIDPLERIIADFRVPIKPTNHYGIPEIITINLEALHTNIGDHLKRVFQNNDEFCYRYTSPLDIATDIDCLCDFLIGVTYNHLRSTLQIVHPAEFVKRMSNRCPCAKDYEFPAFVSKTLSSIGPCRTKDGPFDKLIVFAPAAKTAANYGRDVPVVFNYGRYTRFINALKNLKYKVAPLDFSVFQGYSLQGLFFPLTEFRADSNGTFTLNGTVHFSHYEVEDVVRSALCCSQAGASPFEKTGMTIGYVDDEATLDAIAAVAAPQDIPEGQTASSAGRPVAVHFRVNYYGIQPALAATDSVPAKKRGIYVVGRGTKPYWQCSLAREVSPNELFQCIAFRLTRKDS